MEDELTLFDPTMSPERYQRILEKFQREFSWDGKVHLDHYNRVRYERQIRIWLMTKHEVTADELMTKLNEFISDFSGTPLAVVDVTTLL